MLRFFTSKQTKEKEISVINNGSALQEELISTFNGRQKIPIRSYTAKDLITATNNFAYRVAESGKGYIYKGSLEKRPVLVKKLEERNFSSRTCEAAIRDIAITSQMSQLKNVLKLSGCCLEFKTPALVYEYVEYKNLSDLLRDSETSLLWKSRIQIAIGVANAVLYLHTAFQTPIIYRDLKPSNVIVDQHGVAKLTDFSLSITLPPGESRVEDEIMGTMGFVDPEYLLSGYVTQKSDVYVFGVILLQLLTGQNPSIKHSQNPLDDYDYTSSTLIDYVKDNMEKGELSKIVDPKIDKQGFDEQQWLAMLKLGIWCTHNSSQDRPEMIQVARELRQIHKRLFAENVVTI